MFGTIIRRVLGQAPTTEFKIVVVIEPDEPGYHAYTPGLRGIHAEGVTEDEAVQNVIPLIKLYLDSLAKHAEPLTVGPDLQALEHPGGLTLSPAAHTRHLTLPWPTLHTSGAR